MRGDFTAEELDRRLGDVLHNVKGLNQSSRDLLSRAFAFASRAHEGQLRLSGDPFIVHGLEVARTLAIIGLDTPSVAAGLLHDVVEDTGFGLEELSKEFGEEVAGLVGGLTELGKLAFHSPQERQVESARRMLMSMVQDVRVIFIKLADRLHNMRTLEYLPSDRIECIARETQEIYAPLAHRLGINSIKNELEDLSFRFLEPERYNEVWNLLQERSADSEVVFESFKMPIEECLVKDGIEVKIESRIKHIYSIWNKMLRKGVHIDDIYDIHSMRIITKSVRDCYHALEIVHSLFRPIHDRFKDFIAAPKANMYQSIHTTVMNDTGHKIEVQIRTERMHFTAEYGIAAHWLYKERGEASARWNRWLEWFRQTLDYQLELTDPVEFLRYLKTDLFQNEIYVFTPSGELKQLSVGSTPLDFAYAVHSDIGNHCAAAKVNGRLVPLDYSLRSGDRVEIVTSPNAQPHEKWLNKVKTSRARAKIRQWFRLKTQKHEETVGKELLRSEIKRRKVPFPNEEMLKEILAELNMDSLAKLYSSIARERISPKEVTRRLYPDSETDSADESTHQVDYLRDFVRRPIKGIRLDGMDNIMVRFAKCCQPVPGDPIIGLITRGRGVSVHRANCKNVRRIAETGRMAKVEWDAYPGQKFLVSLIVGARHRDGLVAEIKRSVKDIDTEVRAGHFEIRGGELELVLVIGISDLSHLRRVISEIEQIDNVFSVTRAV